MDQECPLLGPATRPDGTPACRWCGGPLERGRRRWCSDACHDGHRDQHVWARARELAVLRDHGRCTLCGSDDAVQVHHDPPAPHYANGCHHHLAQLVTLCAAHHGERHRDARPDRPVQLTLA